LADVPSRLAAFAVKRAAGRGFAGGNAASALGFIDYEWATGKWALIKSDY
jgi:hypothetical protein